MVRKWKKVDNKCLICKKEVGKFKIEDGKIEIIEQKNFGTFIKVKGKAEMKVLCRDCQRKLDKEKVKLKELT